MTRDSSPRTRSWASVAGFSSLKQRLEPQVGDDFENACSPFLSVIVPGINHSRRLGVRDKYGIDYFFSAAGMSRMSVAVQTKGFEQEAQALGEKQIEQCRKSLEKTRRSANKHGFRIDRFILIINRDLRSNEFREVIHRIGPELLVKAGIADSFEVWSAHDLVNRVMDKLCCQLEIGLSAASRDAASRYLQGGAIRAEVPTKWQDHVFDQHSITDSMRPHMVINDLAAALVEQCSDGRIVVLYGEYGVGKSVTASRLVGLVAQKPALFLEAARISASINSTKKFIGLLLESAGFFQAMALPEYLMRALDDVAFYLVRNGKPKPVLVVDGLDEASVLTAGDGAHRVFNWLKEIQAPVVLSMRTAMWMKAFGSFSGPHAKYLRGSKAPRRKSQLTTIELLPWGNTEILLLLVDEAALVGDELKKKRILRLRDILSCDENRFQRLFGDIPHRPLFLRMLAEYVAEHDVPEEPLSLNKLMRSIIELKLDRDIKAPFDHGGDAGRAPVGAGWSPDKRMEISASLMCGAAGAMTLRQGSALVLTEACTLAEAARRAGVSHVEFDELAVVLNSLLEFDRTQQSSPFDKRRLVFSHRAFQEFFLARYVLEHEEDFAGLQVPEEVMSWIDGEKAK